MKIGLLIEGGIDEILLPPLLGKTLNEIPRFRRINIEFDSRPFPNNGFGEIPKNLKMLVKLRNSPEDWSRIGCDSFIVIHDYKKTDEIQKEIRSILENAVDFPAVYGLAIQEVEAWVLAEHDFLNKNLFKISPPPKLPYAPERDPNPKKTLTDIIKRSDALEYDNWNMECARLISDYLRPIQIAARCPKGFGKFRKELFKINL